ncbi:Uncharacterised protein [uncultured archaeon]|nr:Uncharacterised protein [uncultured archaeon]
MTNEETSGAKAAKYAKSLCKSVIPTEYIFAQNSPSNCENHICSITNQPCVGSHQQFDGEGGHPMYISWYSTYMDPKDVEDCPMSHLDESQAETVKEKKQELVKRYESSIEQARKLAKLWKAENKLYELQQGKSPRREYLTEKQEEEIERLKREAERTRKSGLAELSQNIELWKEENIISQLKRELKRGVK